MDGVITAKFSFLTSGPAYSFERPLSMEGLPELSSPILSGAGPRSFVFTPFPTAADLIDGVAREGELLAVVPDSEGRSVEVFRRLADPPTWWLLWKLQAGVLTSHLRSNDGPERAAIVAASIEIDERLGTPFLLLYEPLKRAASSTPGYQEFATFVDEEGASGLTFMRPGYLANGELFEAQDGGVFQVRAGSIDSIEVQAFSTRSLEEAVTIASDVSASME